jgi:hypothetical protein
MTTLLACAACARDEGSLAWLLVGGLVAAPYGVVALALRALRRAGVWS